MAELTIITTRPERALVTLFGQAEAPEGVTVVTTTAAVGGIPNGSRCFAIWFEPRKYRSAVEWAWIMRRERGGVTGLDLVELGRLLDHQAFDRTPGAVARPAGGAGRMAAGAPREAANIPPVTSIRAAGHEVRP